jgi:hypothetical protein
MDVTVVDEYILISNNHRSSPDPFPMRRSAISAFLAGVMVALGGCTTWGQMQKGLQTLNGQPLDAAVRTLGYPNSETNIAGMHLVAWSSNSSGTVFLPQTSNTYGTAYASNGNFATYSGTTSYVVPMQLNYSCTITMQVSPDGVIQGSRYSGNMGGCHPYIQALNQMRKQMAHAWKPVKQ